jgi:hypothetical protein
MRLIDFSRPILYKTTLLTMRAKKEAEPERITGIVPSLIAYAGEFTDMDKGAAERVMNGTTPTSRPAAGPRFFREQTHVPWAIPFSPEHVYTIGMGIVFLNQVSSDVADRFGVRLEDEKLRLLIKLGRRQTYMYPEIVGKARRDRVGAIRSLNHLLANMDIQEVMRGIDRPDALPTFRGQVLGILGNLSPRQIRALSTVVGKPLPFPKRANR